MPKQNRKPDLKKKDLAKRLHKALDNRVPLHLSEDIITYILFFLTDTLEKTGSIIIPNFGTFSTSKAKSALYKNNYIQLNFYTDKVFKKMLKENRKAKKNV